ncbi:hypothetical protein Trco_001295 [Trichoderma cornu-damae]|uniref:Uncharacterized protein n=1 Tax=Trichoderma cornu-damae TaxID=654480 RepID=A0A9P8QTN5_9HYPO|nr:hypothetical protein Trco_001295 [Trichoderma cornu-damae]
MEATEVLEDGALGHEADGSAAGGNVPLDLAGRAGGGGGLLHGEEVPALVVGERLVADDKGLGVEVQEAVGQARNGHAGGAGAAVDVGGGKGLGVGPLAQGEAKGREGRRLVGDEGRRAAAVVGGRAVLVEDVGDGLRPDADPVQAGADVDAVDVEALDGRLEVASLVGDVDRQPEAGGQLVRGVIGDHGGGRGSSGHAGKAEDGSRGEHPEAAEVAF